MTLAPCLCLGDPSPGRRRMVELESLSHRLDEDERVILDQGGATRIVDTLSSGVSLSLESVLSFSGKGRSDAYAFTRSPCVGS